MLGLCKGGGRLIKFQHTTKSTINFILTPTSVSCVRYNSKKVNKAIIDSIRQKTQQNQRSKAKNVNRLSFQSFGSFPAAPKKTVLSEYSANAQKEKDFNTRELKSTKSINNVCAPKTTACPSLPLTRPLATTPNKACPPPPPPPPSPPVDEPSNLNKYLLAALLGGASLLGYGYYSGWFESDGKKSKKLASDATEVMRVPANSKDLPDEVPFLLIGGGTASFSAFRAIKSHVPKAKVLVITDETRMPYMRPPISKEVWFNPADPASESGELKFKQWNGVDRNLFYEPDDFYIDPTKLMESENGGVAVARGYRVKKIDVCDRKVILEDDKEIKYGACLLATGARPKTMPIFESASPAVKSKLSYYKTIDDYLTLRKTLDNCRSVAVIGGGFLGSELSCALARYGEEAKKALTVYQIFHESGNMGKVLPDYLSAWTTERVKEEGVCVLSQTQIKSAEVLDKRLKLNLMDGNSIIVDHAVIAAGSEPNTELAKTSNLEIDSVLGGYVVNAELEARSNLFVAGDAACFFDPKLGRRRVEHHDHAVVSGRLAGENMVGMKKPYTHQSMFWSDLGPKVGYEAIGLIDSTMETTAIFAKADELIAASPTSDDKADSSPADQTTPEKPAAETPTGSDYVKGVIFYMKEGKVVGILLWNLFNRINVARKIIAQNTHYDDLNEVAKLFDMYDQHQSK